MIMEAGKVKIGVISDTHLPGYDKGLKNIIDKHFGDADLIVHAGDLVDLRVLDMFAGREIKAVCGNMDYSRVKEELPEQLIFEIKGFQLGIIHGWGSPAGIEERLLARLGQLDCIVYGHTHIPVCHKKGGVFFFNPGSPTDKRFAPHRSIGVLEIDKDIKGRIINF
jgi:putative phosphoesterase